MLPAKQASCIQGEHRGLVPPLSRLDHLFHSPSKYDIRRLGVRGSRMAVSIIFLQGVVLFGAVESAAMEDRQVLRSLSEVFRRLG